MMVERDAQLFRIGFRISLFRVQVAASSSWNSTSIVLGSICNFVLFGSAFNYLFTGFRKLLDFSHIYYQFSCVLNSCCKFFISISFAYVVECIICVKILFFEIFQPNIPSAETLFFSFFL